MPYLLVPSPDDADLAAFVHASNEIELIRGLGPGSAEFDDHLFAARRVAEGRMDDPFEIHFALMRRLLGPGEAGVVRTVAVRVGGDRPPEPGPHLGVHLGRLARLRASTPVAGEDPADFAWRVHHELECVHPFVDGNGRTGRLLLNAVRLRLGLPWLTVTSDAETRTAYIDAIRAYRATSFPCVSTGSGACD